MDHQEAVRLQAAEKYVLGELPQALRDAYEEHYFDCPECAVEVRAAAAFVDTSRQLMKAEREAATQMAKGAGGWFFWLRPAFAVPALLVLLAVVGYQNSITIPRLKSGARVFDSFPLSAGNRRSVRGEGLGKVEVLRREAFALDFDFLPSHSFDHYLCQLQDETGNVVFQVGIPAEKAKHEVHLLVANGLERPGRYSVVISGDPGSRGTWVKENEVSRLDFLVDFRP